MAYADNMGFLVGNTPVVKLGILARNSNCVAELYAKLEYYNPASSVKDRLARAMVLAAEKHGLLKPHSETPGVIVEATSGNTGIGLAFMAALRGYRLILTMPESMSEERKNLLRGLGADLRLTPATGGMRAAKQEALRLAEEIPGAFLADQFANPAGPAVHYATTGPELWNSMAGKLDIFVAGVGTGGTISGAGRYLKEQNSKIQVYGVEPEESKILSGGAPGPHLIQGIGAGFVPQVLDQSVLDGVLTVPGLEAVATAKRLILEEGVLAGISSGAAAHAALALAARPENAGKKIAFIACDTADRYLSTVLFKKG